MPLFLRAGALCALLFACVAASGGCRAGLQPRASVYNPAAWPARGLNYLGGKGADTGIPLVREGGRLLDALGDLLDSPALLLEGIFTLSPRRLGHSGLKFIRGLGSTLTGIINLPFFWLTARNVDLGRDAALVNDALCYLEKAPAQQWRYRPDDLRPYVFPPGTRVIASGGNLIWHVPGSGRVSQAAEASPAFRLWNAAGKVLGLGDFAAQERTWGFVVPAARSWSKYSPRKRVITILHEFYHQEMQMRRLFQSWSLVYWPGYLAVFPFTGWYRHWAEGGSSRAAYIVDHGLRAWHPGFSSCAIKRPGSK